MIGFFRSGGQGKLSEELIIEPIHEVMKKRRSRKNILEGKSEYRGPQVEASLRFEDRKEGRCSWT